MFSLSDYRFDLPAELIAETAAHPAHAAKLLVVSQKNSQILSEATFWELDQFLDENSVLFFNNSKVLRARIPLRNQTLFRDGEEKTLKDGEIFFLKNRDKNHFEALVRPGKKFRIGTKIFLGNFELTVTENTDSGRILHISGGEIFELLDQFGELPLPPYIEYSSEKEADYQNIFAKKNGSVAAPTAGLHFSEALLYKLKNPREFVTLHIGLGTFKTIDTDDIRAYEIHSETAEIHHEIFGKIFEYKKNHQKIVAVGTTGCRTLESLPSLWKNLTDEEKNIFDENVRIFWEKISEKAEKNWITEYIFSEDFIEFSTRAYITPGYDFTVIDELITNFHLPESSLLVLVSAMIGQENLLKIYGHAIREKYRFFSFGDGMYLKK